MRVPVILALAVLAGCATDVNGTAEPIGEATMDEDGFIHAEMSRELPGGGQSDVLVTVEPGTEAHRRWLERLGGLKPGETKPVPPWPKERDTEGRDRSGR